MSTIRMELELHERAEGGTTMSVVSTFASTAAMTNSGQYRRVAVERVAMQPALPRAAEARPARYRALVSSARVPGGVVHELPRDLCKALLANPMALDAWTDITALARNEFICWVEDAKQEKTRERRIRRTQEELEEGQRRPCCWPGCTHRERTGR